MGQCLATLAIGGVVEVHLAARKATATVAQGVSAGLDGHIRRGRQAGGDDEEATRPVDDGGQAALVQLPSVHYGECPQRLALKATVRCGVLGFFFRARCPPQQLVGFSVWCHGCHVGPQSAPHLASRILYFKRCIP